MFPAGAGGAGSLLTDPRLDWAMGRTKGIYEGDGPLGDPFSVPISLYDYVGVAMPMRRSMPAATEGGYDKWLMLPTQVSPAGDGTSGSGGSGGGYIPMLRYAPDWQHRILDDLWSRPINVVPVAADPQRPLGIEGHQDIKWLSGRISSMLDPATSPSFGGSGTSPVADFPIHGHDELYRYDCQGRTVYWLAGQASGFGYSPITSEKSPRGQADTAWANGRADLGSTSKTGNATAAVAYPGIAELEMRWPDPPAGCSATGGNGGWLMAPDGLVNNDHPLWPKSPGDRSEWATNDGLSLPGEGGCDQSPNSRMGQAQRWQTDAGGTPAQVSGWPFTRTYDAAGNLANDGRNIFRYDGSNRLKDVYTVAYSGGTQILGNKIAHFDYDALGRQVRSIYNTDGDNDLTDEDTEWTPRDVLGRPIGIWRQLRPTETSTPCAKPYQLFGYNSTGFRGTGYDASGGILDCPAVRWRDTDDDGELDETLFYLQDFRGDVTALVHPKNGIVERVRYGLTGRPETFPAADVDFSGTVEKEDEGRFQAALAAFATSSANYDPRADLDHDGDIDSTDEALFYQSFDRYVGLSGNWKLSQGDGLIPGNAPGDGGYDNRFGWRGYWYDSHLQKYHVRHRVYDPREGRWMQNDPLGFGAGDQDLYRYCGGEYSMGYDPLGLEPNLRPVPGDFLDGYVDTDYSRIAGMTHLYRRYYDSNGSVVGSIYWSENSQTASRSYDGQSIVPEGTANQQEAVRELLAAAATAAAVVQAVIETILPVGSAVYHLTEVAVHPSLDNAIYAGLSIVGVGKIRAVERVGSRVFAYTTKGEKVALKGEQILELEKAIARGEAKLVKHEARAADACGAAAGGAGATAGPSGAAAKGVTRSTTTVLSDVTVVSHGKVVGRGDVYLRPTLEGIESGRIPVRDIFQNRPLPGKTTPELPVKPPGYYQEFVHPTTGVNGVGSQRIIRGAGGELYYTPDHYQNFIPLN